jgi:hypothetical protein
LAVTGSSELRSTGDEESSPLPLSDDSERARLSFREEPEETDEVEEEADWLRFAELILGEEATDELEDSENNEGEPGTVEEEAGERGGDTAGNCSGDSGREGEGVEGAEATSSIVPSCIPSSSCSSRPIMERTEGWILVDERNEWKSPTSWLRLSSSVVSCSSNSSMVEEKTTSSSTGQSRSGGGSITRRAGQTKKEDRGKRRCSPLS